MWRFAWRNLITKPTRTALAVLGLSIPVLAILGLFSVTTGIRALMGDTLEKMQGLMVLSANSPAPVFSQLPDNVGDKLTKVPGVRVVAPEIWKISPPLEGRSQLGAAAARILLGQGRDQLERSAAETILVEGQKLPEHLHLKSAVYLQGLLPESKGGGRFLTMDDVGQPRIVISTRIAARFPGEDGRPKKVGDTLLIGGKPYEIIGIYETGSLLIDTTIVMEFEAARKLFEFPQGAVSSFYVEGDAAQEMDALADRIRKALPDADVKSMAQLNLSVGNIMSKLDMFLVLAVSLAFLVGGVGIANTMLMSAMERYVEFGVMRTNGWTKRNILGLVTTESALIGLLSGLCGTGLAAIIVSGVNAMTNDLTLGLTVWPVAICNLVAIAIATISGLYPAWQASRMTPMDAIRSSV